METRPGQDQLALVGQRMTVWTEPLPNEVEPITTARPLSCRAAATISEAEADTPLTSTTSGMRSPMSPRLASLTWPLLRWRPRVETIGLGEEQVGDRNRLVEQAAEIAAQIEDDALHVRADVAQRRPERVVRIVRRAVIEAGHAEYSAILPSRR